MKPKIIVTRNIPDEVESTLKEYFRVSFNREDKVFSKDILSLIKQKKDLKEKKLFFIKNGLVVYNDREKKIFFDVVKPTNNYINNKLHSGTLSFEFSAKKEKIITM